MDILNEEAVYYAKLLQENGVQVSLQEYKGAPHMVAGMGGVMKSGRRLVQDVIYALKEAFMTAGKLKPRP